jgi:hypothetical protein
MLSEVEELGLWWQVLTPPLTRDRPLRGESGRDGILRPPERDEEGIALGVDLVAACFFEADAQEPLMVGEERSVVVAERLQQARRPSMSVKRSATVPVGS